MCTLNVTNQIGANGVRVGVVLATGVKVAESDSALKEMIQALAGERKSQDFPSPELKGAVRDLLRSGGFKPSGRSKPASEYLAQAAREERFPFINNLVDINNFVSLKYGVPISLLDLEATTSNIVVRYGSSGEKYVFNSAGHEIDITGLLCVCRAPSESGLSVPLGNPVKDSMQGKLKDSTTNVVGFVYASAKLVDDGAVKDSLTLFEELLRVHGGAESTNTGWY